jgi:hypothetical protein
LSKEGQLGGDQTSAYSSEQGGTNKESSASAPRLSHEQLVKGFRDFIQQEREAAGYRRNAVNIISDKLGTLSQYKFEEHYNRTESYFWRQLYKAWVVVGWDHYEVNSIYKHLGGSYLSGKYKRNGEATIKLSDPQVRILDALTEAVGIPHKRGQAEIEIPHEVRGYEEELAKFNSEPLP